MPRIYEMDSHLADLIAAGEVVERPASVVKELVENAIDAGSSAISVEIRRGGMGLISVRDNGCGIAPEDLPTAFLRHATSKLRTEADLAAIGTLGFRGEALAAISAVSRIEIVTRTQDAVAASRLRLEGGVPGAVEECGAPVGTGIAVRDLFYNTPARLKFMRKDSAETAAVSGLMQHLALSHPEISFRLFKDGEEVLHTPGDGKLRSAVYAACGRDFTKTLLEVAGSGGEIGVSGFITAPANSRGSRSMQMFFVNGRYIKSQLLTVALEEAYRNQLMKGRFPGCVLMLTLPHGAVDVNVHPAKTEVKFARERDVFNALYHAALSALEAGTAPGAPNAPAGAPQKSGDFFKSMSAADYRASGAAQAASNAAVPAAPAKPLQTPAKAPEAPPVSPAPAKAPGYFSEWGGSVSVRDAAAEKPPYETEKKPLRPAISSDPLPRHFALRPESAEASRPAPVPAAPLAVPEPPPAPIDPAAPEPAPAGQTALDLPPAQETLLPEEEAPWRIAGEVLRTYIVCESADRTVYLIDKHAAHERVNFDRLKAKDGAVMRQTLLKSAAVTLGDESCARLLAQQELLLSLGFAFEDFGGGTLLVREVPCDLAVGEIGPALEEIDAQLASGRSLSEKRDAILATVACKSAIKGGWESDERELRVLVDKVQRGEIRFCPHGRPVCIALTEKELEQRFGRIQ